MSAIWMRLRAELRAGWRAWLSLALLVGIAGGAATAAAAGARRTESAYPRFVRAQDGFHAMTGGGAEDRDYAQSVEAIGRLPEVRDVTMIALVGAAATLPANDERPELELGLLEVFFATDPEGRALYETNRAKVLRGRLPDRAALDEVSIPFAFAEKYQLDVGDRIIAGIGFDPETFFAAEQVPVTVVGVHAAPGDFDAVGQTTFPVLLVPHAVLDRYGHVLPPLNPETWNLGVHLRDGPSSAHAFQRKIDSTFNLDVPMIQPVVTAGVQRTMSLYAAALWIVAAIVSFAAIAVFSQTMARQIHLEAADYPALRALGVSQRGLVWLGLLRAMLVAIVAAPLVILVAFLASPLMPFGAARVAEPSPGFAFDVFAIGLGVVATAVVVMVAAAWPARRAAVLSSPHPTKMTGGRPSSVVGVASRLSRAPAAVTGLRMALEPGKGRTTVPVRSTILAVAIGLAAVSGVLVVGQSLDHLIDTPELAGFTYDAIMPGEDEGTDAERAAAIGRFDFVEHTSAGTGLNIVADEVTSFLVGFTEDSPIGYAIIDGRAPTSSRAGGVPEIAVGPGTLQRLGLSIGDVFEFAYDAQDDSSGTARARIVGTAAIPPLPWAAVEPGEGGVMTMPAIESFAPGSGGGCCFVKFKDGTDLRVARETLEDAGFETFIRTERADLGTLQRIAGLPVLLTGLFALLGIGALMHVLVTGVRRRRRDLAILKTIGFVRRQVRAAVAWQATTIAFLCLVVGIPAGLVLGRWGWGMVADSFGVVPAVSAPVTALALIVPISVLLANLIALMPARAAAQTQPAVVLRSE